MRVLTALFVAVLMSSGSPVFAAAVSSGSTPDVPNFSCKSEDGLSSCICSGILDCNAMRESGVCGKNEDGKMDIRCSSTGCTCSWDKMPNPAADMPEEDEEPLDGIADPVLEDTGGISTASSLPAPSVSDYHVRAVTYVETEWRGALSGIDWECAGKNCYGLNKSSSARDLAVITACKALAAKIGGVRAFLAEGSRSTEGGSQTLAQCNSGIRIEGETKFYYSARLGRTLERPDRIRDSKYGIVWNCENSACWASISQMDPSWRHCQELRKKVGKILSFQQPDTRLSRSELAQCNE